MGELKDWQAEEIKELRAEVEGLRAAAMGAVDWDWEGLRCAPGHVDWLEALQDVKALQDALKGGSDTPNVSCETPSVSEGG